MYKEKKIYCCPYSFKLINKVKIQSRNSSRFCAIHSNYHRKQLHIFCWLSEFQNAINYATESHSKSHKLIRVLPRQTRWHLTSITWTMEQPKNRVIMIRNSSTLIRERRNCIRIERWTRNCHSDNIERRNEAAPCSPLDYSSLCLCRFRWVNLVVYWRVVIVNSATHL